MYKILIIEDSTPFAERLQLTLIDEGYEVHTVQNGLEGLYYVRKKPPDLVITEILMPVMDGFEVVKALRKEFPDIRIITMTSGGGIKALEYLQAIKQYGVDYTLMMPFRDDYLKNIIRNLVDKRKSFKPAGKT